MPSCSRSAGRAPCTWSSRSRRRRPPSCAATSTPSCALGAGRPRRILYDNLKSVVLDRDPGGGIDWNPTFLDFADHYGFAPAACRPYRAQTKGKVERSVGSPPLSFWPGLAVADLADLNRQAPRVDRGSRQPPRPWIYRPGPGRAAAA